MTPHAPSGIPTAAKVTASVRGRAVVQVSYDGTAPPQDLLGALAADGWRNATPAPPPASAIDWARPDLDAGRSYSVLPWPATTSATFEGTPPERDAAVVRARALLSAAGVLDGVPPAPAPARPAAPPAPRSAPVVRRGTAPAGDTRVEVVVDEDDLVRARARLRRFGSVVAETPDAVFTEVTYRGNRSEVMTAVVRLEADVDGSRWDELLAELTVHRVLEITRRTTA